MSNDNAIAPAFAIPTIVNANGDVQPGANGLTKREYFAAMAMQGLLANAGGPIQQNGSTGWGLTNVTWDQVAGVARRAADALLADLAANTVG